jgi:hypothetical protein
MMRDESFRLLVNIKAANKKHGDKRKRNSNSMCNAAFSLEVTWDLHDIIDFLKAALVQIDSRPFFAFARAAFHNRLPELWQ